jgi:hypothetical protein
MDSTFTVLGEYEGHLANGIAREELLECAENIAALPQTAMRVLDLLA